MNKRYFQFVLAGALLIPGYIRSGGLSATTVGNILIALRWLRNTCLYFQTFGRYPNYLNPTGLSEKMQWRKIFDRNPLFPIFLDKIKVQDYVSRHAPEVRCAELYWHGDDAEAIPWGEIPVPCVVKPNNRSGAVMFIKTRSELLSPETAERCKEWLSFPPHGRKYAEWGYGLVPTRVMIEAFLSEGKDLVSPTQYSFYVHSGRVKFISVSENSGMAEGNVCDTYSREWERLARRKWTYRRRLSGRGETRPRPLGLTAMTHAAEKLGSEVDFVRVDLYDVNGVPYLSELTLYTSGGFYTWVDESVEFERYPPRDSDDVAGADWQLPVVTANLLRRGLLE